MSNIDGKGQKLYKEAKKIIPGGTQLLSKRPEMFLPEAWPSYYKKAKGCEIWGLDGTKYYDFASMGVGSCTIGYADDEINNKVKDAVNRGSMSSLNCPEEITLANKLIDLHPWSEMARFARTGGEACAIATRIARASTKKEKIIFCGYHGWHDWYLSANIKSNKNLNNQLLAGLNSSGIAKDLENTAIPFLYNDIKMFKKIINDYRGEIAAIYMEPVRAQKPNSGFLEAIREIATNENIILVFDEITSGFRENIGGIHLKYQVEPDIAIFGKALGNGFPISAIIGKARFMNAAEDSFISSTFWTENIGFTAALAVIEKYEKDNVCKHLINAGRKINKGWLKAAKLSNIKINITGLEPLTHIDFLEKKPNILQTLYTQEMLKKSFLLGSNTYTSLAYNDEIISNFIDNTIDVFRFLRKAIDSNKPEKFLDTEVKHSGFNRLT